MFSLERSSRAAGATRSSRAGHQEADMLWILVVGFVVVRRLRVVLILLILLLLILFLFLVLVLVLLILVEIFQCQHQP